MAKIIKSHIVFDSDAEPYITQKDVVMCRSGIQLYHKSELQGFITEDNKPALDREWYREYRPANVVVKAKKLFSSLPVTKEHPSEWVNSRNWKVLAGGTTDKEVEVVALEGESEGEIGLKTSITFYDEDLYNYYSENNKEVSVGYTCTKHFVDNPEEVGYDIILDEITEVNHLAITRSGRGGSSVAVIDSLLGGMKPMRTGIFAWLASKKQKDSAPSSFGQKVFEALKTSKGSTEEELAVEMKGVLDSCSVLKDCEEKTTLINAVKDCFDNKDKALAEEETITATFDSLFEEASAESVKDFEAKDSKEEVEETKDSTEEVADSADKEEKAEDSTETSEEKTEDSTEEKTEDSTEEKKDEEKKEDACKNSLPIDKEGLSTMIKDSLKDSLKDILTPMVMDAVKECLGIKENTKVEVTGGVVDSGFKETEEVSYRDYSEFLEG